jgi:predicted RecA/RadA family phage recombinase
MAKNEIQEGKTMPFPAPYAVASGAGALIGAVFGVSLAALANGEVGQFSLVGVWQLPKATGAAASLGARAYWNDTNKNVTASASGNTLIGVFVPAVPTQTAAYASGDTLAHVRLNGAF